MLWNIELERALLGLACGQQTELYGVIVWRLPDGRHWSVMGQPAELLLVAINQLAAAGFRAA